MNEYKPLKSSAPPTSILSPSFVYVNAAHTDIRARFDKVRREQAKGMLVKFQRKT